MTSAILFVEDGLLSSGDSDSSNIFPSTKEKYGGAISNLALGSLDGVLEYLFDSRSNLGNASLI